MPGFAFGWRGWHHFRPPARDSQRGAGATAEFYARVFGWRLTRANALGFREVDTGGVPGGIWPGPPGATSFVQLFVEVEDVDAAITAAQDKGATVIVPRSALPDGDVMAVLRDPQGLSFGILERATK